MNTLQSDSHLDLVFERIAPVAPKLIWDAWTQPEQLKQWFTPAPWKTIDCEIDLRPGGMFRTVMLSPENQQHPNLGCYLEVDKHKKLVWTNALQPGFRPAASIPMGFVFTAAITFEPITTGTRYTAVVYHSSEADCKQHNGMGFQDGWGKAYEQLLGIITNNQK